MARPSAPEARKTSTSTVGLPRESRTSRPTTCSMLDIAGVAPVASVGHVTCSGRQDGVHPVDSWCSGVSWARNRSRTCSAASRSSVSGSVAGRGGPRRPRRAAAGRGSVERPGVADQRRASRRPATSALRLHLRGVQQRRQGGRDAVHDAGPALLGLLDLLPVAPPPRRRSSAVDVAEHVRVAADQLVVDAPGHVGQGEAALLGGERGVEHDLEQQVAQLLLEVRRTPRRRRRRGGRWPRAPRRPPRAGGGAGCGGSARGPTGTRPAGVRTSSANAHQLAGDRRGQRGDVERREVVGLDRPVEVVPRHLDDALVGQAEALQHDGDGTGRRPASTSPRPA